MMGEERCGEYQDKGGETDGEGAMERDRDGWASEGRDGERERGRES